MTHAVTILPGISGWVLTKALPDVPHALGVCVHRLGSLELLWKFISLPHKHLSGRGLSFYKLLSPGLVFISLAGS